MNLASERASPPVCSSSLRVTKIIQALMTLPGHPHVSVHGEAFKGAHNFVIQHAVMNDSGGGNGKGAENTGFFMRALFHSCC